MTINLNELANEAAKRRTASLPQTGYIELGPADPIEQLVDQMRDAWHAVTRSGGRPIGYVLGIREKAIIRDASRIPHVFFSDLVRLDTRDVVLDDLSSCIGVTQ